MYNSTHGLCFVDSSFPHYVACMFKSEVRVCISKEECNVGLDVEALGIYFNFTYASTQLMNGKMPWRGGREKDFELMQILRETMTTPSSVVPDAYACKCCFMTYIQNVQ